MQNLSWRITFIVSEYRKKTHTTKQYRYYKKTHKFVSVSASQVLIEVFSSSFIVSISRADWDKCLLSLNNCRCTFQLEEVVVSVCVRQTEYKGPKFSPMDRMGYKSKQEFMLYVCVSVQCCVLVYACALLLMGHPSFPEAECGIQRILLKGCAGLGQRNQNPPGCWHGSRSGATGL